MISKAARLRHRQSQFTLLSTMDVTVNIVLLGVLLLLLIVEEVRMRKMHKRVDATRQTLRTLSHQIRSPLTRLKKYNVFLQGQQLGNMSLAQMEALSKMEEATQRTAMLLNRLLVASRIEEGNIQKDASIDVRNSIEGAVHAVSGFMVERKHKVRLRLGRAPLYVAGDPLLLHGIFDELILNAAHYTRPGGTITIAVKPMKTFAQVTIRDTGIGIDRNEQKKVFTQFFRGEQAKKMTSGNGLGLSFAQQFTHDVGGNIHFTSKPGKGTVFTVELPYPSKRAPRGGQKLRKKVQ